MEGSTAGVKVLLGDQRKGIIALAIPIAVALLVQQMNNVVDSFWVSGLGGDSMAALGMVYPIYCVLIGIGNGLGIGVSSAIARNIGRKNKADAEGVAGQGILLSVIVSVPLTILLVATAAPSMDLMGAGDMTDTCLQYAYPIYISSFFIILSGIMSGMLRGEGAAKRSMWIQAVGAVVNIILDPIFIFTLDMGVAGAAWATSIAFAVSCAIAALWYVRDSGLFIRIRASYLRFDMRLQRDILSVGLPEAVELTVMNFFNVFLNFFIIVCGGTDGVAVYSTMFRLMYLIMIPAQAIGGAMVAVCAAEYGMRRFDMIRDAYRFSIKVSMVSILVLSAVMFLVSDPVSGVFTQSEDMHYMKGDLQLLLRLFVLYMPVMSLIYIGSSLMQAVDRAKWAMLNSLGRNLLLTSAFGICAYTFGTLDSLWFSVAIVEFIGGSLMAVHASIVLKRVEGSGGTPADGGTV